MALGPASHVKPVPKQTFGRAPPEAAREAAGEALPNGALLDDAARRLNQLYGHKRNDEPLSKTKVS